MVCTAPVVLALIILLQFAACAAFILFSRSRLAMHGDRMDEQPGMELTWIGVALMASLTSLSELLTCTIHFMTILIAGVPYRLRLIAEHIGRQLS